MPKCAICGRSMRQIGQAHLRTHGMTVKEYQSAYGEKGTDDDDELGDALAAARAKLIAGKPGASVKEVQPVSGDSEQKLGIDRALLELQRWMTTGETMSKDTASMVEHTQNTPEQKFRTLVSVVAMQSVPRMGRLLAIIDKGEEKFFDQKYLDLLATDHPSAFLRLLEFASSERDKLLALMKGLSETPAPTHSIDKGLASSGMPPGYETIQDPKKRAELVRLLSSFLERSVPKGPMKSVEDTSVYTGEGI